MFNDASIRSSLDIGEDQGTSDATSFHVDSNGNMWSGSNSTSFSVAPFRVTNTGDVTANSLTLTGRTSLSNSGNASIFLTNNADGIGLYNNANTPFYVDATDQFSLGNKLTWANSVLTVQGNLKLIDGSDVLDAEEAANIAQDLVDEFGNTIYEDGFIGGLTVTSNTMYYGTGSFASGNTAFYVGKNSGGQANFSLGNKLTWDGATLSITGNVVITGGTTLALINDAQADADAAATAATNAQNTANAAQVDADAAYAYADTAFDTASNKITIGGAGISVDNNGRLTQISGDVIRTGLIASPGNTSYLDLNNGTFNFGGGKISWNGGTLSVNGDISGCSGTFAGAVNAVNVTCQNGFSFRATGGFPAENTSTTGPLYAQTLAGQGVERIVRFISLREFKENIEDMPNGLSIINNLRPRIFSWKRGEIDPVTNEPWTDQAKELMSLNRSYGFIVEEVLEAQPELISFQPPSHELPWDEKGGIFDIDAWKPAMWNTIEIIPILTKAIQELSAKVEELESRLNS